MSTSETSNQNEAIKYHTALNPLQANNDTLQAQAPAAPARPGARPAAVRAGAQEEKTPELPVDGLPSPVREYIGAVCDVYHTPREFVTAAVLATAATAVGKRIRVVVGPYSNRLVLWFVLVARSGSNKSYPMKMVTAPLRAIDKRLYEEYLQRVKKHYATPKSRRPDFEPRCRGIVVDDCTDERRNEILFLNSEHAWDSDETVLEQDMNRGAIGIYPELKGMFDSMGQYTGSAQASISRLLRMFDSEDIKVDRKGSCSMLIHEPVYNILGDLQTGMLQATFGSEQFGQSGLNQRFLFCVADDIEYPDFSTERLGAQYAEGWRDMVERLYSGVAYSPAGAPLRLFNAQDDRVVLSADAMRLYEGYYNRLQRMKARSGNYGSSVYAKLQIQVVRLAGTVHALEVAQEAGMRIDPGTLHARTMEYAVRCMDYFEAMAFRVYDELQARPTGDKEPKLQRVRRALEQDPTLSVREIAALTGIPKSSVQDYIKILTQN